MLITRPAAEWEDELNALGVPAGRVLSLPQALEQARKAGQIAQHTLDGGREAELFRTGIKIDGEVLDAGGPPPELGEHTDEVLAEFGLSESKIAELRNKGAI